MDGHAARLLRLGPTGVVRGRDEDPAERGQAGFVVPEAKPRHLTQSKAADPFERVSIQIIDAALQDVER